MKSGVTLHPKPTRTYLSRNHLWVSPTQKMRCPQPVECHLPRERLPPDFFSEWSGRGHKHKVLWHTSRWLFWTWAIKYAKMKIHLIDVHISCDVKGRLPQSNSCDGSRGRHGIVYHKPSWLGDQTIITALSEKWLISSLDITWATSKGRRLHKYGWFLGILQFFPK